LDNRTKRLIIKEAEKILAKLILMISKKKKKIKKKNLKEMSRWTKSYSTIEKLKGKYNDKKCWYSVLV